jgi:hypothetical protein
MQATTTGEVEHFDELKALKLHDRDLVHELSRRLESLFRYAQCIANAEGDAKVQQTWHDLESQELANIRSLKQLITDRIEKGDFLDDL